MTSVHFQGKPFNITVIQVYAPTSNAEEAEVEQLYKDIKLTPGSSVHGILQARILEWVAISFSKRKEATPQIFRNYPRFLSEVGKSDDNHYITLTIFFMRMQF